MAMGTRTQRQRQEELWYRRNLGEAPGHPFYRRLNEALDEASFDEFCEARCCKFYHKKAGATLGAQWRRKLLHHQNSPDGVVNLGNRQIANDIRPFSHQPLHLSGGYFMRRRLPSGKGRLQDVLGEFAFRHLVDLPQYGFTRGRSRWAHEQDD